MDRLYRLPWPLLARTFSCVRECGRGFHECQALWVSSWLEPELLTEVVHPKHRAYGDGFVLDDQWLNDFWLRLGAENLGIRFQVHTHPRTAFHSPTDDAYPIIHKPGFLSLVIPNFGLGPVGFDGAYLTEIQADGAWRQVSIGSRLVLE